MTREEFALGLGSITRHLMTAGAGILAAHGLAGGDQLAGIGSAIAVFGATLAWSYIEKNKMLAALCGALPVSELEALAVNLASFKAQGANPLLIAHVAQTVSAIANTELAAAHPELVQQAAPQEAAPAPVVQPAPIPGAGDPPPATMIDGITHYPAPEPQLSPAGGGL